MKVTKQDCHQCKHCCTSRIHYGRTTCGINNVTVNELYYTGHYYECNYYEPKYSD